MQQDICKETAEVAKQAGRGAKVKEPRQSLSRESGGRTTTLTCVCAIHTAPAPHRSPRAHKCTPLHQQLNKITHITVIL
ncbi:unnamed protein product [Arctia plantaginis]|uniref:Uncharacterized protein n=1 Tax=Arctia plantaginis TaxID=874455 RepID=A0A8S1BL71_ARCPL|nr:unnamed protein product [Arctia plantaginis]CAB3260318.1 unnamed protein product [Arctia plantaginis]